MTGGRKPQAEFQSAFVQVISRAVQQCNYVPATYVRAANMRRVWPAVRRLLAEPVSDDSLQLWARGRKDLTIEAMACSGQWRHLFGAAELEVAARRLARWSLRAAADDIAS